MRDPHSAIIPHRPIEVHALVDWNSQVHAGGKAGEDNGSIDVARHVMRLVCRDITRILRAQSTEAAFRVRLRLYCGWHKGYERTARRNAVYAAKGPSGADDSGFSSFGTDPRIVFTDAEFGDRLLFALDRRLHRGTDCHLPGTLLDVRGIAVEKMVDTALAADLLYLAARERGWLMVIGEDKDLVPPIFVAEAMLSGTDRRMMLLARNDIRLLDVKDLQCR